MEIENWLNIFVMLIGYFSMFMVGRLSVINRKELWVIGYVTIDKSNKRVKLRRCPGCGAKPAICETHSHHYVVLCSNRANMKPLSKPCPLGSPETHEFSKWEFALESWNSMKGD